jgi:Tol biopolymer transport system component
VFTREQSEDQRIDSVDLRTGQIRLLNDEPEGLDNTDGTPAWSPDGRQMPSPAKFTMNGRTYG